MPFEPTQETTPSLVLTGDKAKAQAYIPSARKLIDMVQSQLNQGANLGESVRHSFPIAEGVVIHATVMPGVVSSLTKVEIVATEGVGAEEFGSIGPEPSCPNPPFGTPGRRYFSQIFGHTSDEPVLEEVEYSVRDYSVPDIIVEGTQDWKRAFFEFPEPFLIFGRDRTSCWLDGGGGLWFGGPNTINLLYPDMLLSPCTRGTGGTGIIQFAEDIGGPQPLGNEDFRYLVSAGGVGNNWLDSGSVNDDRNFFTVLFGTVQDFSAGFEKDGELIAYNRKVLILQLHQKEDAVALDAQFAGSEVVFLYAQDGCPAYIGFFYGGADALSTSGEEPEIDHPFGSSTNFCNQPVINNIPGDVFTHTWVCEQAVAFCQPEGFFFTPPETGFKIQGASGKWNAYGAFRGPSGQTGSATDALLGRAFWIELDGDGMPVAGVAQAGRAEQLQGDNFAIDDIAIQGD